MMNEIFKEEPTEFKVSLNHEVCNLPRATIERNLECAFSTSNTSTLKKPAPAIKELFLVRDPLERLISSYYFWGELALLHFNGDAAATTGSIIFKKTTSTTKTTTSSASLPTVSVVSIGSTASLIKTSNKTKHSTQKKSKSSRRLAESVSATMDHGANSTSNSSAQHNWIAAPKKVLGRSNITKSIFTNHFQYHGNELTVPPIEIAAEYAKSLPLETGLPGPSYYWSLFSNNPADAVAALTKNKVFPLVIECLDESLVAMSHYLEWSIADVVIVKPRKALSSHPKARDWPQGPVAMIKDKLVEKGEYEVYNTSKTMLDKRIAKLRNDGVDFDGELVLFKALQRRVSKVCLNMTYLESYRKDIAGRGHSLHQSNNKLRDVEQEVSDLGHVFMFNRYVLVSYDVCGSCEAHAALLSPFPTAAPAAPEGEVGSDKKTRGHSSKSSKNGKGAKRRHLQQTDQEAATSALYQQLTELPTLSELRAVKSPLLQNPQNALNFAKCPRQFGK
jgi:hypothetical protein